MNCSVCSSLIELPERLEGNLSQIGQAESVVAELMALLPPQATSVASPPMLDTARILVEQLKNVKRSKAQKEPGASSSWWNSKGSLWQKDAGIVGAGASANAGTLSTAKTTPIAVNASALHSQICSNGTRIFDRHYRENWKVRDWVEMKHKYTWIPANVLRVIVGKSEDLYHIKLENGDIVLNVQAGTLRTRFLPHWDEALTITMHLILLIVIIAVGIVVMIRMRK